MSAIWFERALWAAAVGCAVFGLNGIRAQAPLGSADPAPTVMPSLLLVVPTSDSLIDAAGVARELDLFRIDRAAVDSTAVAGVPGMPGASTQPPPSMRPTLILRGLVGGRSLEAIVEGIPGVDGAAVLRAGEAIGGITLRAVRRDTAILVAKDTTWKLTVRRF